LFIKKNFVIIEKASIDSLAFSFNATSKNLVLYEYRLNMKFKNKRVLVIGAGVSGLSSVKFFVERGAKVTV